MGETPADTEREINRLRGDMTATLEELERRVRGGVRSVATAEARRSTIRAAEGALERVRHTDPGGPTLLGVAGVVGVGAVAYGAFALMRGRRRRNTPQNRLKRGVQAVREELSERVGEGVETSLRQLERALPRGVLLKLVPEDGGYVRLADARLEPPSNTKRGQSTVIKKFVWAALLSIFMALGSVVARRVADSVWRATVREEPPTSKRKVDDD